MSIEVPDRSIEDSNGSIEAANGSIQATCWQKRHLAGQLIKVMGSQCPSLSGKYEYIICNSSEGVTTNYGRAPGHLIGKYRVL